MASSPSASPSDAASSGWRCAVHRGLPFTSTDTLCIHELFERRSRRPTSTKGWSRRPSRPSRRRATSATSSSGARAIMPSGVRSTSGSRGLRAPRSIAVRVGEQHRRGTGRRGRHRSPRRRDRCAAGSRGCARGRCAARGGRGSRRPRGRGSGLVSSPTLACTSERDHQVVDERRIGRRPGALQHEGEPGEHLPLVGLIVVEREHRLAVVGTCRAARAAAGRGRSGPSAARTAPGGSRRRGGSSR